MRQVHPTQIRATIAHAESDQGKNVPPAALTSRKRASFQNNSDLTELYHSIGLSVSIVQKLKTKTVNNAEQMRFFLKR